MRRYLYYILGALIVFSSCAKDVDEFVPDANQIIGPDTTWYTAVSNWMPLPRLKQELILPPAIDSVTAISNETTVITKSGFDCTLYENSLLDDNGMPVNDNIALETKLVTKKGDWLKMAIPTLCNDEPLSVAGAFFVQATRNGKPLKLATDKLIKIKLPNWVIPTDDRLRLYNGNEQSPSGVSWTLNADTTVGNNKPIFSAGNCELNISATRWMNLGFKDQGMSTSSVRIAVYLPNNYTNANTEVFLLYGDVPQVVMLQPDNGAKCFKSIPLPVGKSIKVVTITKDGNFYYLGHTNFVTSSNNNYQRVTITPSKKELAVIKDFLDNL